MSTDHLTPQQQKIIDFARSRGSEGFYSWEITGQLYILGYTERITELRQKGFNIVNVRKNFYVLNETQSYVPQMRDVENQLQKLRQDWTLAKREKREQDMRLIELKAKVLKLAQSTPVEVPKPSEDEFTQTVQKALL